MDVNQTLSDAVTAFRSGDFSLARDLSEALQRKHPGEPGSLRILGQIEYLEGNIEGAATSLKKSLKAKPEQFSIWIKLGNAYADLGDFEKSEEAYTDALNQPGDKYLAYLWRAQTRALMNNLDGAFSDLDEVITLNPGLGQAYRLMVRLGHPKAKTADFAENLSRKLATGILKGEDAIQAHYALGGFYEASGEADKLWDHLKKANALQNNRARGWAPEYQALANNLTSTFTADFIKSSAKPAKSVTPIFIVGLPRSGSTLLEKMLAGHPKVAGAGETNAVPKVIGRIQMKTLLTFPSGVETLTPNLWATLADGLLETLQAKADGKPYVVDKLLSNAFFVGLILKMVPNARFLHLKRDLLDTAFSIYKNHFWETQSPEFCSLESIGTYARLTNDLMAAWKKAAKKSILEVGYEDLVNDPKKTLRGVLDFCGLEWHDGVMDHRNTKTKSNTLSTAQVHEPLNKKSIGTGHQYQKQLGPFLEALNRKTN